MPRVTFVKSLLPSDTVEYRGIYYAVGQPYNTSSFEIRLSDAGWIPPPSRYSLYFTGQVDDLTLNGVRVLREKNSPYANFGSLLRRGEINILQGRLSLTMALPVFIFGLKPSWNIVLAFFFMLQCSIVVLWLFSFRKMGWFKDKAIWIFVLIGSILRLFYAFSTPYFSRSYDVGGHLDYIQFLAEHWGLPQSGTIWEAYQMPLYYLLLAPLYRLGELLGLSFHEIAGLLQMTSVVFAILTLTAGVRMTERFFLKDSVVVRFVALVLATCPWLIYLSSQITNDALVTLIGFLWSGALMFAYRQPSNRKRWILVGVLCGFGMLTKMSSAPWIGISILAALLPSAKRVWRLRVTDSFFLALYALMSGGWLYLLRTLREESFGLVANAFSQWGASTLPLSMTTLFGFNPLRLISLPFREFDSEVESGHVYMEDIARTLHFGSVELSPEAAIVYVLMAVPMVLFVLGSISELRKKRLVLLLQIVGVLAAGILMRIQYPFPPSQHVRYVATIILPISILIGIGASSVRSLYPRTFLFAATGTYAFICGLLTFAIGTTG